MAFAQYPASGSMSASHDENFNLVVNGNIRNNKSNVNITTIEVKMFYGTVHTPNNMWKDQRIIQVAVKPGLTGNFSLVFEESYKNAKASSCSVTRVRFSDGSVYKCDGLDFNGLHVYF